MGRHRLGLPLAVVATVVAAAAATLALRPRSGLIEPAAVDPKAYFSAEQIERAEEFRGPQRALGVASLAVSGGVLGVLALRPPTAVRRALARAEARPLVGGAAVGAGVVIVLAVATLPIDAVAHARSVEVGLSTQGVGAWLLDVAKATGLATGLAAAGSVMALLLVRRFPRRAWIPGSAAVVALSAAFVFLSPLLLEPLFNRFTPLPRGELRSEVLRLAERAGLEVGEVYRVDASRRTTGANAYVGGLGQTKRVVLYDTLIDRLPPDQVRSVIAHELAHVRYRDLLRGLAWVAIVAPAAVFLAQLIAERVAARTSGGRGPASGGRGSAGRGSVSSADDASRLLGTPATVPAIALALAVVSFGVGVAGNVVSRQVEARADAFALRLAADPAAFIGLERSLAVSNVAEPDPPEAWHLLFETHPTTVERIGYGVAYAHASR